jgi:PAS domain S-box-containing protein
VSKFLDGTKASIPKDILSALPDGRLRESLELFFHTAPAGFFIIDADSRFILVNEKFASLYGLAPDDLTGRIFRNMLPGTALVFEPLWSAVFASGAPSVNVEIALPPVDGHVDDKYWLANFHPLRDEDDRVQAVGVMVQDTTYIKQAEDAVRESEERYRLIVENQTELVCRFLPDGTITFVNDSYCRYFSKMKDELVGSSIWNLIPDAEHERCKLYLESITKEGKTSSMIEHEVTVPDGRKRWQQWTDKAIYDDGKLVAFQSTGRDITDRKMIEESLAESERRYALAVKAGGVGIWDWRVDTGEIFVDPVLKALIGYEDHEIKNDLDDWCSHVHPDDMELVGEVARGHIEGETPGLEVKHRMIHRDGGERWFLARGVAIERGEDGRATRIIGTDVDITEHELIERAHRDALYRLSRLNSHEKIIRTITESIHRSIDLPDILENAVESMWKNIENADQVAVFLVEGENAVLKAQRGFPDWFVEKVRILTPPEGFIWRTLREKKPLFCPDADRDTIIGDSERSAGIESYTTMPISCEGETIGCIVINSRRKNAFDNDETGFLEDIAGQLDVAVKNARQAGDLKRALGEIVVLKDQLQAENIYLREEVSLDLSSEDVVGQSEAIKKVLAGVGRVAGTDSTVLITGETGTGKELIAHVIHAQSRRRGKMMVKVNCANLPPTLIESELFGREKGAYTGALTRQIGRFELANGSTIFLDEIGELSPELQAKLLRVLQEGQFERLGAPGTVEVDIRVIAATNRNLAEEVKAGRFREDLYYRLNVFPIHVPPLRERPEDIPSLIWMFVREFSAKMGKRIESVSKRDIEAARRYTWPGNVRELKNVIERAMILTRGNVLRIELPENEAPTGNAATLREMEREHILATLARTGWKVRGKNGAAEALGMKPSTLESRMAKLGIKRAADHVRGNSK